jgi:broad specificity phosphatase PhoE
MPQARRVGSSPVLVLVRHGQTRFNVEARLAGRLETPLTPFGRLQAEAVAAAVTAAGPIIKVVSSPLSRARQTAAAFGQQVDLDDRWIELDYGEFDGYPATDVPATVWRTWRADADFAPPGGETLSALGARVGSACSDLADEAATGNVVVVSHVSPIKAAVIWALGVSQTTAWRMFLGTASITRIGVGPDGPSMRSFNESAHLDRLPKPS